MTNAASEHSRSGNSVADSKRWLWSLSIAVAGAPFLAAAALLLGGPQIWAFFPLLFFYGVMPVLDTLAGEDPFNPSQDMIEELSADRYFTWLLIAAIVVFYLSFFGAVLAATTLELSAPAFIALALGAGAASGGALAVGHELGHRTGRHEQIAALIINALSGYGHFRIEHNRGHHVAVATPEDSASARLGESVWRFALREIPGGAMRGWRNEARRLRARGADVWSLENEILQGYLLAGAIAIFLVVWLGPLAIPFLAVHHVAAWLQLTFANYVEHYGLLRERRDDGRYEPCEPRHSWNSNHIVSNLSLFHLQRHSDHHANPMVPYQALRNFDGLPSLPSGYPGCFVLAAIPPLWFKVMDPRALSWAGGDAAKLNVAPHRRSAYGV